MTSTQRQISRDAAASLRAKRVSIRRTDDDWELRQNGTLIATWAEWAAPNLGDWLRTYLFHVSSSRRAIESEIGRTRGSVDGGNKAAEKRAKSNVRRQALNALLDAYITKNPERDKTDRDFNRALQEQHGYSQSQIRKAFRALKHRKTKSAPIVG